MKTLLLCLVLVGCSNPPSAKTVEVDLCKARRVFVVIEAADLTLQPAPDSPRAKVEAYEDALCAVVSP